ncbi:chemotaxis protein CheA [Campylobacterota bacterium]|nr:chemotaxis protein CheA [Campylobacterota bacterium]
MDKEQLKNIFLEEANEIIEKLDIEILNFEESPTDKSILNELFRGVHTLKGSANSFGFTRLGKFVHKFEDVLDYYRSSDDEITRETIDLFLESVDMVKAVMGYETNGTEGEPENYQKCLDEIIAILEGKGSKSQPPPAPSVQPEPQKDLASEFGNTPAPPPPAPPPPPLSSESIYEITLKTDRDIYFRGYDHATFFRLLSEYGSIVESVWDLTQVPPLEHFNPQDCVISSVIIRLDSQAPFDTIKEVFEFLEDNEYEIKPQEQKVEATEAEPAKTPKPAEAPVSAAVETPKAEAPVAEAEVKPEVKAEVKPEVKTEAVRQSAAAAPKTEISHNTDAKSFVKIDTSKLDELFDSIGELVIAQNFLAENRLIRDLEDEGLRRAIETLSKITRLIQSRVMSLRMVPIKDTFEKMRRVVRDASKKVNKEIHLVVIGEDTEIDKTMVDQLSDPLIHLIRNSIDHGVEATVEDRRKAGKEDNGIVTLCAHHKGGNIAIEVSDDGRGINRDAVLKKAIERGLAKEDDDLTDAQVFSFILQAGFSTADKISDISGRGVGLDVVHSSIEAMHGKIEIESTPGKGSSFRILLPLTLAIIDGMLVRSGREIFIIPTLSIIESLRPSKEIVHTAQGKGEFVNLRSELLPVVRLNHKLHLNDETPPIHESTLVCAENEKGRFAILVDELVGRQQVVIKPLGNALATLKEVSGGAVMGNGEIALIINVEGLYND